MAEEEERQKAPEGVAEEKVGAAKRSPRLGPRAKGAIAVVAVLLVLGSSVPLALLLLPCLPPNLPFVEYNASLPRPLTGRQLPKDWLSGAIPVEVVVESDDDGQEGMVILGPESLARRGGSLFTGLLGGNLVKLTPSGGRFKVTNVTKFGEPCEDISEGLKCGRPMGMRFHSDGLLYVTDAYLGLYSVNVDTGEKIRLAKSHDYISGRRPLLANDLDIAKDGMIYWSDASTNAKVEDVILEFMSEPSGRLIRYDPVQKRSEALIRRVQCASGVQLSPDEDFVLVAEGGKDRILRYYLKGPKTGSSDIFVDGLPGVPDKIRRNGRPEGGYLVWCIISHGSAARGRTGGILPWLREHKAIRTIMMRGLFLIEKIFQNAHERFGDSFSRSVVYSLGNLASMKPFLLSEGLVLELDAHGNITGSFYSADRSVQMASEMHVLPGGRGGVKGLGRLYIASPVNPHLLQVPVNEGAMLNMAMAYSRGNTAPDYSPLTVTSDSVDSLYGKSNDSVHVSSVNKSTQDMTSFNAPLKMSVEDSSMNKIDFLTEQNALTTTNDPGVEISDLAVSKGGNASIYLNQIDRTVDSFVNKNRDGDSAVNHFTTESSLDSFFATVESSSGHQRQYEAKEGTSSTIGLDRKAQKGQGEDDLGNLVSEDSVLKFLLDSSKRKVKEGVLELDEFGDNGQSSKTETDRLKDGEKKES